ncbi:TPA: hypothetical protein UMT89_000983 [Stenotrophomonas maltophilia]|nr:hypothetical protein [Stenotrophomonas maltophilia]
MSSYQSLITTAPALETLSDAPPLSAFAEPSVAFVDALSAELFGMPEARSYPELTALAFWMRRSSIVRLKEAYLRRHAGQLSVARGTVLHFAPSNVDTIFVYSWFISLLCGNRNIVRLSTKSSVQTDLLVGAIGRVLSRPEHAGIARRSMVVRYAADARTTALLSAQCDTRVIWGGDATVAAIRQVPLPATATEIAFANKFSLGLFDAGGWLAASDEQQARWIDGFFNDAYWFDQMACSSPRLILWVGTEAEVNSARDGFWPVLEQKVRQKGVSFGDVDYVNKRIAQDLLSIETDVSIPAGKGNDVARLWLETPALHADAHCGAGLFFESRLAQLDELRALLSRKVQTVSYLGMRSEQLRDFVQEAPLAGVDRFVPVGSALDFASIWDGFDLMTVFTREIAVA